MSLHTTTQQEQHELQPQQQQQQQRRQQQPLVFVHTLGTHAKAVDCGGGGDCGPLCLQYLRTGSTERANEDVRPVLEAAARVTAEEHGYRSPREEHLDRRGTYAPAEQLCIAAWRFGIHLTVHIPKEPARRRKAYTVSVHPRFAGVRAKSARHYRPAHMLLHNDHYFALLPVHTTNNQRNTTIVNRVTAPPATTHELA